MMDAAEYDKRFVFHPVKDGQASRYENIRAFARDFAVTIDAMAPDSREKSLAMTKIEEAVFWAIAAIARNE